MTEYQRRVVDDELDELMPTLPAIALEGPKGGRKDKLLRRGALSHRFLP